MRFGRQTTIMAGEGGVLVSHDEKFYEYATVQKVTTYTESVKVKDVKDALAEFLKLMDKHKAGDITDFSLECITGKDGRLIRIEKSWVVPDLC